MQSNEACYRAKGAVYYCTGVLNRLNRLKKKDCTCLLTDHCNTVDTKTFILLVSTSYLGLVTVEDVRNNYLNLEHYSLQTMTSLH